VRRTTAIEFTELGLSVPTRTCTDPISCSDDKPTTSGRPVAGSLAALITPPDVAQVVSLALACGTQPDHEGSAACGCGQGESNGCFDVKAGGGEDGNGAVRCGDQQLDFSTTEDNAFGAGQLGGVEIPTVHVDQLLLETRIVGQLGGLDPPGLEREGSG
jgi:hypothetical protein